MLNVPPVLEAFFYSKLFPHKLCSFHSLPITIVEFGDIYLTVTSFSNFSTSLRRIDFSEFCEAIVRIALRAFQKLSGVGILFDFRSGSISLCF